MARGRAALRPRPEPVEPLGEALTAHGGCTNLDFSQRAAAAVRSVSYTQSSVRLTALRHRA